MQKIFEIVPSPLTLEPLEYLSGKDKRRERRKKMRK